MPSIHQSARNENSQSPTYVSARPPTFQSENNDLAMSVGNTRGLENKPSQFFNTMISPPKNRRKAHAIASSAPVASPAASPAAVQPTSVRGRPPPSYKNIKIPQQAVKTKQINSARGRQPSYSLGNRI